MCAWNTRRETSYKQLSVHLAGDHASANSAGDNSSGLRGLTTSTERDENGGDPRTGVKDGDRIAIIEGRIFLRECIRRAMQAAFSLPLDTYASIAELEKDGRLGATRLVIICWSSHDEGRGDENASSIPAFSEMLPGAPVIVLAHRQEPELAHEAITLGARGYIPMSMGFDIAVEAVRFVLAGGTYVPAEFFLAKSAASTMAVLTRDSATMNEREMLVVRAIQQGKPNKIIAYELNMCESTVKVHVRSIMRKLGAKNRTTVAMEANGVAAISRIASR